MAKISDLPQLANPTGAEAVVAVSGGVTKRVTMAALVNAAARPVVDEAKVARSEAQLAASAAVAAGNYKPSRAEGEIATPIGGFFATKDAANILRLYERTTGGSVEISAGAFATLDGEQTLLGKTLGAGTAIATDGSRLGLTDGNAPLIDPGALLHIVNTGSMTCALRSSAYWEGSAEAPFQNNDTSLWETFNRISSSSRNLSWSISAPNAYNDIADDVYDDGERVGALGWAVSVHIPGLYEHHGILAYQFGLRGRAGFQGPGSTGTVENAIGVRGEIYNDSAEATIKDARAGEFISTASTGTVERNHAIYAGAANGTVCNFSFYGAVGDLFNQDQALFGSEYSDMPSAVAARGVGPTIEFGFPEAGYGSSLGSTVASGRPYVGWHCRASETGDNFDTQGRAGYVGFLADGSLIFARVAQANAADQPAQEAVRFDEQGRALFQLGPDSAGGYRVGGKAVVGAQGASVTSVSGEVSPAAAEAPTKQEYDMVVALCTELKDAVNALLARVRDHGLIAFPA